MQISYLAFSLTLKMEEAYSSERPLTFDGLHDIVSQKREVSMRTSDPTSSYYPLNNACVFKTQFVDTYRNSSVRMHFQTKHG
jgi:hypothetical protein